MYADGMRRIKHNIQTYYRTRLFWLKNDKDKEKSSQLHSVLLQINKKHKHKQETKTRCKKSKEIR